MRKMCITSAGVGLALLALHWVGAGSAMAVTPPAATLTHLWNFDGNLNDAVGGKTADALGTGTAFGTPTGGGISGQAAQFDGINDLLYVAGMDAIPAGAFTLSFWEYCTDPNNQGYLVSDAAVHPEYKWENLMLRRRLNYADDTTKMRGFGEIGAKTVYSGGWLLDEGYWDPRYTDPGPNYGDDRLNPTLPTGEWVHHVITNYAMAADTNNVGGRQVWYVDGQVALWGGPQPDPFSGLQPLETEPITDPQDPFYFPNRREGFVIGNLIDNTNVDNYNENYVDNERIGPTGNYHGYIDSFQVYTGTVTPDQVRYLHENPGADLRTYAAPAASAQPKGAQVYHWKFDGNLAGELVTSEGSTSSYTATAVGNAAAQATGGASGGAAYFDGVDDAVTINKAVLPAGDLSVVFWTKEQFYALESTPTRGHLADGEQYWKFYAIRQWEGGGDPVRNKRIFECTSSTVWSTRFGQDGVTENVSWAYDTWYQHAIIIDANGDTRYYVNGQLYNETGSLPFAGLIGDLYLGNNGALAWDFKGYMDDLQIYNWDISADDVAWLWANAGQALAITGGGDVYQPYDVNEDGFVGADDLDVVRAHWGESGPGGKAIGDINLDEFVGADDLDQLRAHWGEVCPPIPGLVPEPSTFVLLLMGALALIAVRRVR